jgi:hypothetical protein
LSGIADDDELATALDQVESPSAHLGDKGVAADLAFDVAHGAADDARLSDRLGGEEIVKPGLGQKRRGAKHLHPESIVNQDE